MKWILGELFYLVVKITPEFTTTQQLWSWAFQKNQVLTFSRAILPKHSIHYKNTMCKIFLKHIDDWGFPKPPKILMFLDENLKT